MSVRAGREFLAIPGPTTVPDEVLPVIMIAEKAADSILRGE